MIGTITATSPRGFAFAATEIGTVFVHAGALDSGECDQLTKGMTIEIEGITCDERGPRAASARIVEDDPE